MKINRLFTVMVISVASAYGLYNYHSGQNNHGNYNELILENIEALTFTDVNDPRDRHGMCLEKCYETVDFNGYQSKQLVGEHCKESYPDDVCNSRRSWGKC